MALGLFLGFLDEDALIVGLAGGQPVVWAAKVFAIPFFARKTGEKSGTESFHPPWVGNTGGGLKGKGPGCSGPCFFLNRLREVVFFLFNAIAAKKIGQRLRES